MFEAHPTGGRQGYLHHRGLAARRRSVELAADYAEQCGKMAQVAVTLEEALDIAERAVTREDIICITGSFYLVGKAKKLVDERYKMRDASVG